MHHNQQEDAQLENKAVHESSKEGQAIQRRRSGRVSNAKEELALRQIFPKSGTKTFLRRLKGWQEILKNFLTYVEAVVYGEKKRYADSVRLGNECLGFVGAGLVKDGDEEATFSVFEMHQVVLKCLLDSDLQLNYNFTASLDSIEKNVMHSLRTLLQEVRRKCQESEKEWLRFDNELRKDEGIYNKLRDELAGANEHFGVPESARGSKQVYADPHITFINLRKHVLNCLMKRDKYCDLVLEQQASFFGYEIDTILKPFYKCIMEFFQWRGSCSALSQEMYKKLLKMLDNPDYEKSWEAFVSNNREYLNEHSIKSSSNKKKEITEDLDSFVMQPCSRVCYKGKILKKAAPHFFVSKPPYKPYFGVITTPGYLHLYKPELEGDKDLNDFVSPELTIYLHDCTVGPLVKDASKTVEAFVVTERGSGLFAREVKHKFTAESSSSVREWHGLLNGIIKSSAELSEGVIDNALNINSELPSPQKVNTAVNSKTLSPLSPKAASNNKAVTSLIDSLSHRSGSSEISPVVTGKKKKTSNFASFPPLKVQAQSQNSPIINISQSQASLPTDAPRNKPIPQDVQDYMDTLNTSVDQIHLSNLQSSSEKKIPDNSDPQMLNGLDEKYNVSESYEYPGKYDMDELVEPNPWGGSSYAPGDTLQ